MIPHPAAKVNRDWKFSGGEPPKKAYTGDEASHGKDGMHHEDRGSAFPGSADPAFAEAVRNPQGEDAVRCGFRRSSPFGYIHRERPAPGEENRPPPSLFRRFLAREARFFS